MDIRNNLGHHYHHHHHHHHHHRHRHRRHYHHHHCYLIALHRFQTFFLLLYNAFKNCRIDPLLKHILEMNDYYTLVSRFNLHMYMLYY
jgi:hypothetical protein